MSIARPQAIGRPRAAEVPTAWWMTTLHHTMKGIDTVPAGADQGRQDADADTDDGQPGQPRQLPRRRGLAVEEHLQGRIGDEDGEQARHHPRRQQLGDLGADQGPEQDAGHEAPDDVPADRATLVVGPLSDEIDATGWPASDVATAIFSR